MLDPDHPHFTKKHRPVWQNRTTPDKTIGLEKLENANGTEPQSSRKSLFSQLMPDSGQNHCVCLWHKSNKASFKVKHLCWTIQSQPAVATLSDPRWAGEYQLPHRLKGEWQSRQQQTVPWSVAHIWDRWGMFPRRAAGIRAEAERRSWRAREDVSWNMASRFQYTKC